MERTIASPSFQELPVPVFVKSTSTTLESFEDFHYSTAQQIMHAYDLLLQLAMADRKGTRCNGWIMEDATSLYPVMKKGKLTCVMGIGAFLGTDRLPAQDGPLTFTIEDECNSLKISYGSVLQNQANTSSVTKVVFSKDNLIDPNDPNSKSIRSSVHVDFVDPTIKYDRTGEDDRHVHIDLQRQKPEAHSSRGVGGPFDIQSAEAAEASEFIADINLQLNEFISEIKQEISII